MECMLLKLQPVTATATDPVGEANGASARICHILSLMLDIYNIEKKESTSCHRLHAKSEMRPHVCAPQ